MSAKLKISVGQFPTGEDKEAAVQAIRGLAEKAVADGARVLLLPEAAMFHRITSTVPEAVAQAEELDGPFATEILKISKETGLYIVVGISTPASQGRSTDRAMNVLLAVDNGEIVHSYEKIHLYDAFAFKESDTIQPGSDLPPVLDIDGVKVGMVICYDLRFPELFRTLTDRGAEVIFVAAAWARGILKEDHWLTLLRARAIENTAYVFASDDVGVASVGRSVIYDPLGIQLGDAGEQPDGLITAVADTQRVADVRATVPSLENRRIQVSHEIDKL